MPLNVAMVSPNLTLGGAERWLVDLIKHSDPHRLQWTGCAVSNWGGLDRTLGTELRDYTRLVANKLPRKCRISKFPFANDLVHKWTSLDFRSAIRTVAKGAQAVVTWGDPNMEFWFKSLKIPRIICSHTTLQEETKSPITGITHLTAVSQAAMEFFAGRLNYERLPKQVLPNGVDPSRVCPHGPAWRARKQIRAFWGLDKSHVVVGYLGRQSPEKNPQAAALAVRSSPANFRAVFYGNGPQGEGFAPSLVDFCDLHIHNRYQMYAPVAEVGKVLPGFDVLVLASRREAFSLSLIEAWLNGIPVIATPVGSIPELERQHGQLVFSVPVDFTETDLQVALGQALDGRLRKEVVQRAKHLAQREFTIAAMVERWTSYLEAVA